LSLTFRKRDASLRCRLALACGILALGVSACGTDGQDGRAVTDAGAGSRSGGQRLSGTITIEGGGPFAHFAQAAARGFMRENPRVRVTLQEAAGRRGVSTACTSRTDIAGAAESPGRDSKRALCSRGGNDIAEVQIGNEGIALVTNENLKIDCMTIKQLNQLWGRGSEVGSYAEIDPGFPDEKPSLFGASRDTSTFAFFNAAINGAGSDTRRDYGPSADGKGVARDVQAAATGLGYLGFAAYEESQDTLNLVGVDAGSGCRRPDVRSIEEGTYGPLARPLYLRLLAGALKRPEVKAFLDYISVNGPDLAKAAQIVPLSDEQATRAKDRLAQAEATQ